MVIGNFKMFALQQVIGKLSDCSQLSDFKKNVFLQTSHEIKMMITQQKLICVLCTAVF